eukprot:264247-Pleurochrysis_carterae.AAC.1
MARVALWATRVWCCVLARAVTAAAKEENVKRIWVKLKTCIGEWTHGRVGVRACASHRTCVRHTCASACSCGCGCASACVFACMPCARTCCVHALSAR